MASAMAPMVAETCAVADVLLLPSFSEYSSTVRLAVAVTVATFCAVSPAGPPDELFWMLIVPDVRVSTSSERLVSPDAAVREAVVAPVPIAAHFGADVNVAPPLLLFHLSAIAVLPRLVVVVAIPNAMSCSFCFYVLMRPPSEMARMTGFSPGVTVLSPM